MISLAGHFYYAPKIRRKQNARRFYQKRGFALVAVHRRAVDEAQSQTADSTHRRRRHPAARRDRIGDDFEPKGDAP